MPWSGMPQSMFSNSKKAYSLSKWRDYSLAEAASYVAKNGTVIVCAVSQPYLPFLNNWLISITRQKHQEKVLVIAEDYATLYKVNEKWPGHAVLVPPAPDAQTAHKFGSQVQFVFSYLGFVYLFIFFFSIFSIDADWMFGVGILQFYFQEASAFVANFGAWV